MFTGDYVDLMFAWGHARLGDADTARQLAARARERLHAFTDERSRYPRDDFARAWLLDAFLFRIDEAAGGRAHGGPWPSALSEPLRATTGDRANPNHGRGYVVDRMRQLSRVLEPVELVDPYRQWKTNLPRPLQPLHDLLAAGRTTDVTARFVEALRTAEELDDPIELGRFLTQALLARGDLADHLGERLLALAEGLVGRHLSRPWSDHPRVAAYFAKHRPSPSPKAPAREWERYRADRSDPGGWVQRAVYENATAIFDSTLTFVEGTGRMAWVARLVCFFLDLYLGPDIRPESRRAFGAVAGPVSRALMRMDQRPLAEAVADRLPVERLEADLEGGEHEPMIACLAVAALNLWLGRPGPAGGVFERTRARLPRMTLPTTQVRAACDYIDATGLITWAEAATHLRHLLGGMPGVPNAFTTAPDYSRFHLEVADHVVMVVAAERPGGFPAREATAAERTSRREALIDLRAKLVAWGEKDWGPPTTNSDRARPGHADAS